MSVARWTWGGADEDWVTTPDGQSFRASGAMTARRIVEGMNIVEVLDAVKLRAGLERIDHDQHEFGTRPCGTCEDITETMGTAFGCVKRRLRRDTREAARSGGKATP